MALSGELVINTRDVIGKGAFATVFGGKYQGMPCAIKVIFVNHFSKVLYPNFLETAQWERKKSEKLRAEMNILLKLQSNPNVVLYYGCKEYHIVEMELTFMDIVMERCDGTIVHFLADSTNFPGIRKQAIMRNMASGLEFIHSHGIIHKDIKPDNVLLSNKDGQAKLTDFGISKEMEIDQTSVTNTSSCTNLWAAPEIIDPNRKDERLRPSIDIFSMGLVFYHLITEAYPTAITGQSPYDEDQLRGKPTSLRNLIDAMTHDKSKSRISAEDVLDHPYLDGEGPLVVLGFHEKHLKTLSADNAVEDCY